MAIYDKKNNRNMSEATHTDDFSLIFIDCEPSII